jgi:hypothetical protein
MVLIISLPISPPAILISISASPFSPTLARAAAERIERTSPRLVTASPRRSLIAYSSRESIFFCAGVRDCFSASKAWICFFAAALIFASPG